MTTDQTPRPGELTDAEVVSEFVSTLIGSYINPDATERTRLERDSQAHRAELLRRLARVPPADTVQKACNCAGNRSDEV